MVCFAFGCGHAHERGATCRFFRFPKDSRLAKKWNVLCRRKDRVAKGNDRLCSCHFVDGQKKNGPSMFKYNRETAFEIPAVRGRTAELQSAVGPSGSTSGNPPGKVHKRTKKEHLISQHIAEVKQIREDHTYSFPCVEEKCQSRIKDLELKAKSLEEQLVTERGKKSPMSLSQIRNDNEKMLHYTSFPIEVFMILVNLLSRFNLQYTKEWVVTSIPLHDQLLITLMKLRLNLKDLDLAHRFNTGRTTIAIIFRTFISALHELFIKGIMDQNLPSVIKCNQSMPKSFEEFRSARIIMDATEITQDVPGDLNNQSLGYSSYKSRHTMKSVTCVAPNGSLVYASPLYPGSTSDVAIVRHCEIMQKLVPGDLILADKGFTLYSQLPAGVSLNIPPFLSGKAQFTEAEAKMAVKIARARIHVERANERMKNYTILGHIPASYRNMSSQIFQVCAYLINLQSPLIKEVADNYKM